MPFLGFCIATTSLSISMAYIVEMSGGSVFLATLAHFTGYFLL